ncbi:hypothetical protein HS041_22020 [Planomonospora sp. ID67723]|uniref:hypothetical protein n=1 Tax=Planomonospora sp. ID67723 TaxID=2738134 RepID=UPI0018C3F628|nr:hypothetical protein [Planomonospora sp. ID67723]MBG0830441.1 hypothetical protein [Planomonospora sp. ID67723]
MRILSVLVAVALVSGLTGCTAAREVPGRAAPASAPSPPAPAPSAETSAEEPERPRAHRTSTEHYEGSGDRLIPIPPTREIGLVTVTAHGRGSFIVQSVDASGDDVEFLARGEGHHRGTRLFNNLETAEDITALRVTARGSWRITLDPPSSATVWRGPQITGSGDAVIRLHRKAEGAERITSAFTGDSNFIVEGADEDDSALLANEIGSCEVERALPDGTFLVIVTGDGPWTLRRTGPGPRLTATGPPARDDHASAGQAGGRTTPRT